MSQQLQITGGAKVRALEGVITGTSGVLSSVPLGAANGVATLDAGGKVPVSQLPSSVVTYLGTWNAATNTPTLVNGTGDAGDLYICNVAGTVNFGAGPIAFVVGDWVLYGSGTWQKSSGQNGTVTSVAASITGNSLGITGSPITTAGTLAFAFAGTNLQYINGAGNLTTFPTLISSIGLSMPSAFSVSNSPLTANGTIAVTGAGYVSQYIRGDGTLADFPSSGGGGSSVSYYLNGGTSQGVIGGTTYYEMSKTADTGTGVDFNKTGDGFIVAFLTDAGDPAQLNIPAGNWNYEIYASMSANGGTPQMYAELYVYNGTTFTLISTSSNEILYDGTNLNLYTFAMTVPATTLSLTDRLAVKLYATNSGGKTTTIHTQDSHLCQVITTFSTGITALNGLTAQVQYFATGTSGTDFNISSTTATHTFNIPSASATNRGLITTGSQTIAGDKAFTGINSFDYGINYKTGASLANVSGYISQAYATSGTGAGSTLSLKISDGNSVKAINLDFVGSPATYTYTFPAATGTLALLQSTQTFSGVNTFSALTSFTFSSGTRMDYGPYLTKGSVPTVFSGTTTNIYSDATTNNIVIRDTSSIAKLVFDNSTQTYTFPSASGTLALTSNLSAYLPLTGGTLSGSLSASTYYSSAGIFLLTSGQATSGSGYATINGGTNYLDFRPANGGIFLFQFPYNTTRTFTLPDATGTLPLGTGTTNYHAKWTGTNTIGNSLIWDNGTNVGIGNTNTSYTLDVSGTGRFTGALTLGTTAAPSYGSGSLGVNLGILNIQNVVGIQGSYANNAYYNGTNWIGINASYNPNAIRLIQTGDITFHSAAAVTAGGTLTTWDTTDIKMTIKASGNVGIGTTSPTGTLDINNTGNAKIINLGGATTGYQYLNWTNTGANILIGIENSTGGGLITGGSAYATVIATQNATNLIFGTNAVERMRITSGGDLLVSSTTSLFSTSGRGNIEVGGTVSSLYGLTLNNVAKGYLYFDGTHLRLHTYTGNLYVDAVSAGVYLASNATSWTANSDIRLKNITGNIENAIDSLLTLRTVKHTWKSDDTNKEHLALIAQDVEKVFPQLIDKSKLPSSPEEKQTDETEYLGVRYTELIPVLVKAIQELSAQNKQLQDRIYKLENK